MAFANVAARSTDIPITAGAPTPIIDTIDLSGLGTISAGDGLLALVGVDGGDAILSISDSWQILMQDEPHTSIRIAVLYKDAAGSDSDPTIETSGAEKLAVLLWRFDNVDFGTTPPEAPSTSPTALSNAPDPPDFTPAGGALDYTWIAGAVNDDDEDYTAYPTSPGTWTDTRFIKHAGSGGLSAAAAEQESNAASMNPTTFTFGGATEDWGAVTIAVLASGAGDQTITPGLAQELVNTFDPAITTGPVTMTPGLQQQLVQGFDPVLTTTVTFTPGLEQQLAQGFDPVITTGPVTLSPGLLQQLAQAFDPALTTTVEMTPGLLQQLITAFDPVVTTGAVSILPALLQQLAQGVDPTIALDAQTLTPGLLQQLAQGFDPTVTPGAVTITPGLLQQLVQAFDTTVTPGPATLAPDLAQQLTQAFDPVLSAVYFITPDLVQQLVLTFDPTVDPGAVTILPALIQELVNTFDPTLTTVVTISPGLANQSVVAYDPAVTLDTDQTIQPDFAQQVTVTYDPVVSPGAVTITVDLVEQLVQAFGPVVGGDDQPDALTTMGDWSD